MKIKARWVGGSDETHIGTVEHDVDESLPAEEVGKAVRDHIAALGGTHNEFYMHQVVLEVSFERVAPI